MADNFERYNITFEQEAEYEAQYEEFCARELAAQKANTISAKELLQAPKRKIQEYIPNLAIAGGLTILAGEPKAGKSVFMYHALDALVHEKEFLGCKTRAVPVLYASELTTDILHSDGQLDRVPSLADTERIHFIPYEKNGKLDGPIQDDDGLESYVRCPFNSWEEQIDHWKKELRTTWAKILVVDTLVTFAPMRAGDGNDSGVMARYLAQLKHAVWSVSSNISIIVIHHLRKGMNTGNKDANDIAGSYAIRASSDLNVMLAKVPGSDNKELRTMKVEGRIRDAFEQKLRLGANGYVVVPDREWRPPKSHAQRIIADAIAANPELGKLSERELVEKLTPHGVTRHQVKQYWKDHPRPKEDEVVGR